MFKSTKKFSIFVITDINNTTILKLGLVNSFDMANKLQALSDGYMHYQAGSECVVVLPALAYLPAPALRTYTGRPSTSNFFFFNTV